MIKNYLKIAFRTLRKNKLFTGINTIGLAVAIGAGLILLLTAFFQLSFDRFHEDADQIYRVYWEEYKTSGVNRVAIMPAPFAEALLEESPEVQHAVRWAGGGGSIERGDEVMRVNLRYADPGFFKVFSFPLLKGDAESVLSGLNSVVLSEKVAAQLFGEQDAMGKTVAVKRRGAGELNLTVTGIISDPPPNSTLDYGMLTRFENSPNYASNRDSWDNVFLETFVQLHPESMPADLAPRLKRLVNQYQNESVAQLRRDGAVPDADGEVMRYQLQPLADLHFDTAVERGGLSKAFPYALILIAVLILAIASINFVNLTLGSSLRRATEVGVRKVMGASRRQLVLQFFGESLLMIGVALIIGLALTQWLLPEFNALFDLPLRLNHPHLLPALAAVVLFIGLAGGAYPAFVLSRFEASTVLRGGTNFQKPGRLRNLLVLFQFTFSVLLIACTIIVGQQLNYLRNKPMGFNKEQVISIPLSSEIEPRPTLNRLRNELSSRPEILHISAAYRNLGLGRDGSSVNSIIGFTQNEREVQTHWQPVDYDYIETMGMNIVAGRSFERGRSTDSTTAIVINQTFAKNLGLEEPVGKVLDMEPKREIIGVVQDFHFQSLATPVAPVSLTIDPEWPLNYIVVRVRPERPAETMALLENIWNRLHPKTPFMGSFLDENVNRLYETEAKMGKLFTSASVLAIVLSCLGLFGVSLLVITLRTKEIGIRKVLGASLAQIIGLVTGDFLKLVGVAVLLATPVAWWAMREWLSSYAYRIEIQWWVFLLAGILAAAIAFLTLSWNSMRAARSNPVEALRDE